MSRIDSWACTAFCGFERLNRLRTIVQSTAAVKTANKIAVTTIHLVGINFDREDFALSFPSTVLTRAVSFFWPEGLVFGRGRQGFQNGFKTRK